MLVPKVEFVSATGDPAALVTGKALFSWQKDKRRFRLESVHERATSAPTRVRLSMPRKNPGNAAAQRRRTCAGPVAKAIAADYPDFAKRVGNTLSAMNAPEKLKQFDREARAVGNIVHLEHFNVHSRPAAGDAFYVVALGGTRDPYLFMGLENMWVNFGRTQVHLPSRAVPPRTEVLRGTVGFVVPSLAELKKRLGSPARR